MKKLYKEPTTEVYRLKIESLMESLSVNGTTDSGENSGRVNNSDWDEE